MAGAPLHVRVLALFAKTKELPGQSPQTERMPRRHAQISFLFETCGGDRSG